MPSQDQISVIWVMESRRYVHTFAFYACCLSHCIPSFGLLSYAWPGSYCSDHVRDVRRLVFTVRLQLLLALLKHHRDQSTTQHNF